MPSAMDRPHIVVTLANPERSRNRAVAEHKNARYLEALGRRGADAVPLDERTSPGERSRALATAHGLLITGGADIDPSLYGEAPRGSGPTDAGRDALDRAAFEAAAARDLPTLGICRGLQAINVFSGGRLVQHVEHHESPPYPAQASAATRHGLRLVAGTRLEALLGGPSTLEVNSFHHQAVEPGGLANGLRVSGLASHAGGELVEALESEDAQRWLFAVQCHPERSESSPDALDALWVAFVEAAARVMVRAG